MINFIYSIIRYTPDAATGEFINIGVIVANDKLKQYAVYQKPERAKILNADVKIATSLLGSLIEETFKKKKIEKEIQYRYDNDYRSSAKFSCPMSVLADNVDDALKMIMDSAIIEERDKDDIQITLKTEQAERLERFLGLFFGDEADGQLDMRQTKKDLDNLQMKLWNSIYGN